MSEGVTALQKSAGSVTHVVNAILALNPGDAIAETSPPADLRRQLVAERGEGGAFQSSRADRGARARVGLRGSSGPGLRLREHLATQGGGAEWSPTLLSHPQELPTVCAYGVRLSIDFTISHLLHPASLAEPLFT